RICEFAKLGRVLDVLTEHIASRDMQEMCCGGQALGLGAFAGAGWAKKDDEHLANEPFVVSHQELRFELLHRVEHHRDDNQKASARNRERPDVRGEADEEWQDG